MLLNPHGTGQATLAVMAVVVPAVAEAAEETGSNIWMGICEPSISSMRQLEMERYPENIAGPTIPIYVTLLFFLCRLHFH
jgi:hypothetical protein